MACVVAADEHKTVRVGLYHRAGCAGDLVHSGVPRADDAEGPADMDNEGHALGHRLASRRVDANIEIVACLV
jgi:hypothetical protein